MAQTQQKTLERILIVDDSSLTREVIQRNLVAEGYQTDTAEGVEHALGILRQEPVDLVITDLKMPDGNGIELVEYVRQNHPNSEVMLITGYPSINDAVHAVKHGATEYLVKPFTDQELLSAVQRSLKTLHCRRLVLHKPLDLEHYGLIGSSPAMESVFELVAKAAASDATLLIHGESGTGKELIARAVHYHGSRRTAPFVTVNCSAIPENLIESELFGHVKGAFTDARGSRAGFFQIADGGTIFLDEIGDASLNLQAKLLRVLQTGEMFMVGSSRVQMVNVRVVAASHRDLAGMIPQEKFREDLFYRLNVIECVMPPLRQRGDDILLLVNHFLRRLESRSGRKLSVSEAVLNALRQYDWPGNVRELENLMQRVAILVDEHEAIGLAHLPVHIRGKNCLRRMWNLDRTLAEVEKEHIAAVLKLSKDNKTKAAKILGINRKTLREKLKRYDLSSR